MNAWAILVALLLPMMALGGTCQTEGGRAIRLGHSYKLDWFTVFRIQNTARSLGYAIDFIDLRRSADASVGLRGVDALLIPGGADINPSFYIREGLPREILAKLNQYRGYYKATSESKIRDRFEYDLYQSYFAGAEFATMPALGICRGMQMMAVSRGVPLILDIKAELSIPNRLLKFDRFEVVDPTGIMAELFGVGGFYGFENHHQNPRADYLRAYPARHPDLKVTATSSNGKIIEAIEFTDRPAMGVQFHPEKSFPHVKDQVFGWLLQTACERTHHGDLK